MAKVLQPEGIANAVRTGKAWLVEGKSCGKFFSRSIPPKKLFSGFMAFDGSWLFEKLKNIYVCRADFR